MYCLKTDVCVQCFFYSWYINNTTQHSLFLFWVLKLQQKASSHCKFPPKVCLRLIVIVIVFIFFSRLRYLVVLWICILWSARWEQAMHFQKYYYNIYKRNPKLYICKTSIFIITYKYHLNTHSHYQWQDWVFEQIEFETYKFIFFLFFQLVENVHIQKYFWTCMWHPVRCWCNFQIIFC